MSDIPLDLEENPTYIPPHLPHERVFPIQVGTQLFHLSGASLSSDDSPTEYALTILAPSYFTQWFREKLRHTADGAALPTLYLDRDPDTFRDIALHLQGYHVQPRSATHYVRIFSDAQFYMLPKFMSQLQEESIFITIGQREFRVARPILADPANSPNFFSVGFALFFSQTGEVFPGLDRATLLRPPAIEPPCVPARSAALFEQVLELLEGYPVRVESEAHREQLLEECRYYGFIGAAQKLLPHTLAYNSLRQCHEITLGLEHLTKSGLGLTPPMSNTDPGGLGPPPAARWVTYKRPRVDDTPAELIMETGQESMKLTFAATATAADGGAGCIHVELLGETEKKLTAMMGVLSQHTPQPLAQGDPLTCLIPADTAIRVNGQPFTQHEDPLWSFPADISTAAPTWTTVPRKRRRVDGYDQGGGMDHPPNGDIMEADSYMSGLASPDRPPPTPAPWVVCQAQWRLQVRLVDRHRDHRPPSHDVSPDRASGDKVWRCFLVAVMLDVLTTEKARNQRRQFVAPGRSY